MNFCWTNIRVSENCVNSWWAGVGKPKYISCPNIVPRFNLLTLDGNTVKSLVTASYAIISPSWQPATGKRDKAHSVQQQLKLLQGLGCLLSTASYAVYNKSLVTASYAIISPSWQPATGKETKHKMYSNNWSCYKGWDVYLAQLYTAKGHCSFYKGLVMQYMYNYFQELQLLHYSSLKGVL